MGGKRFFRFDRFIALFTILSFSLTQAAPAFALRQREPERDAKGVATPNLIGLEEAMKATDLEESVTVRKDGLAVTVPLHSEISGVVDQMRNDSIWREPADGWNPDGPRGNEAGALQRLEILFQKYQGSLPAVGWWDNIVAALLAPADVEVQEILSHAPAADPHCRACTAFVTRYHRGGKTDVSPAALAFDEAYMRARHALLERTVREPSKEGASQLDLHEVQALRSFRGDSSFGVVLEGEKEAVTSQILGLVRRDGVRGVTVSVKREGMDHFLTLVQEEGEVVVLDNDFRYPLVSDPSKFEDPHSTVLVWTSLSREEFKGQIPETARLAEISDLEEMVGCCGIISVYTMGNRVKGFLAGLVGVNIQGPFRGPHGTGAAFLRLWGALVRKVAGLFGPWLEMEVGSPLHPTQTPSDWTPEKQEAEIAQMERENGLTRIDMSTVSEEDLASGKSKGAILPGSYGNLRAERRIPFKKEEILGPPQGPDRRGWYEKIRDELGLPLFVIIELLTKQLQMVLKKGLRIEEPDVTKTVAFLRETITEAQRAETEVQEALARPREEEREEAAPSEPTTVDVSTAITPPRVMEVPGLSQEDRERQRAARRTFFRDRGITIGDDVDLDEIDSAFDRYIQTGRNWKIVIEGKNTRIGKDTQIGRASEIRNSVLGDGVVVQENASIRDSALEDRVVVGKDASILDSIVHAGTWVGSGVNLDRSHIAADIVIHDKMKLENVLVLSPERKGNRLVAPRGVVDGFLDARVEIRVEGLDRSQIKLGPVEGIYEEALENVVLQGGEGVLNIELKGNAEARRMAVDATYDVGLKTQEKTGTIVLEGEVTRVGPRSFVGRGARVSHTYLEQEVVVGENTSIELSYLGARTVAIAPRLKAEKEVTIRKVVTEQNVYLYIAEGVLDNYYIKRDARLEYVSARVGDDATFGQGSLGEEDGAIRVGSERGPGYLLHSFLMLPEYITEEEWLHFAGTTEPIVFTPATAKAALDRQDDSVFMAAQKNYARDFRRKLEQLSEAPASVRTVLTEKGEKKSFGAKGVIGEDAVIRHAELEDVFVGDKAILDPKGAKIRCKNCTIKSRREAPTVLEGKIDWENILCEHGVNGKDVAFKDAVLFEHTHVAFSNGGSFIIMPGSGIENQQILHSIFGGEAHHPGIILAEIDLEWCNNSAEATIENHEGLAPRNVGKFTKAFKGGGDLLEYPLDTTRAPWLLMARGLSVPRQKLAHPFCFMMPLSEDAPKGYRQYNMIWPAAYLWRSFAAMIHRREASMRERSVRYDYQEHQFDRDNEVFNSHTIQAMIESRDELSRFPRDIRDKENLIQTSFNQRDAKATFQEVLPILRDRAGIRGITVLEKISNMGQRAQELLGKVMNALEGGDIVTALSELNTLLDMPGMEKLFSSQHWQMLKEFRAALYRVGNAWNQALEKGDFDLFLGTFARKEWYVGSATEEKGYWDYNGLGANVMPEAARQSAVSYSTRYIQWYFLIQLVRQVSRIAQHAPVYSWEEIRDRLQRPFFRDSNLVLQYVQAKRDERNFDAQQAKRKLLAYWRMLPEEEKLGLQGEDEEKALQEAIAWDFCLANWDQEMQRPLGREDAQRLAQRLEIPWSKVSHKMEGFTLDDFMVHRKALEAVTDWIVQDVEYSGADRWVEYSRPILRDFWATEGVPTIKEKMNILLGNFRVFMEDALGQRPPGADRSPTVQSLEERLGTPAVQNLRDEIGQYLDQVNPDQDGPGLLVSSDYDDNAVRNAFLKLEGTIFPVLGSAASYPSYQANVDRLLYEEIFQRRGGKREGGEAWAEAFERQWGREGTVPMAGPAFTSMVEMLYRWAAAVGHLDQEIFDALERNDVDAAQTFGWVSDELHREFKTGLTKPDLLGTYTSKTAELAVLFYLWHARWAVFGGISEHATQPFVSYNGLFFGAQNGVLDEGLYDLMRRTHVKEDGIRYSSENDGEVIVNHCQAIFDRHTQGKLTPRQTEIWRQVDRFVQDRRQKQGRPSPESSPWAQMEHDNAVAIWTALIELSTEESQFAMDIESALDPLSHHIYSHNRRILIFLRKDTGQLLIRRDAGEILVNDMVLTSERTAGSGLWSAQEREKGTEKLWKAKEERREAVQRAKREARLDELVPEYGQSMNPDAFLQSLRTQLQAAESDQAPQAVGLRQKVEAIELFRKREAKAGEKEREERAETLRHFAYQAVILDGKGAMARVRPIYDQEHRRFRLEVALARAGVETVTPEGEEFKVTHLKGIQVGRIKLPDEEEEEGDFIIEEGELDPSQMAKGDLETYAEGSTREIGQGEREPGVRGGIFGKNWHDYRERVTIRAKDPEALSRRFDIRDPGTGRVTQPLGKWKRLFIIGEGSSYFVGKLVEYVAKSLLPGIEVIVMRPSEALGSIHFTRDDHPARLNPHTDLAFLLSWSGETDTIIKVSDELRKVQLPGDPVVGVLRIWIGGRIASSLAHIGRTNAGAVDVQTLEEPQVWATKNKAAMNQVTLLVVRDLAKMRMRSRETLAAAGLEELPRTFDIFQEENVELVRAAESMSSETQRLGIKGITDWEGDLGGWEFNVGRITKYQVLWDSPAGYEIALKFLEGINVEASYHKTDDKTYWYPLLAETFPDREGKLPRWQNRTLPVFGATQGTKDNLEAAERELAIVKMHHHYKIPLIVVTTEKHPYREQMKQLIAEIGLPEFFVHEIPKVADKLQPIVDEMFSFWFTAYAAKRHGLTPPEIDTPQGLAKTITISQITPLKALSKSIEKERVTLDQMIERPDARGVPPNYVGEVLSIHLGKPEEFLHQAPLEYQRILDVLLNPQKRALGLDLEYLRRVFGNDLGKLRKVTFLTDSACYGVPLSLELPTADLLRVGTGIQSVTDPFPEPLYTLEGEVHEPQLVIVLAEGDPERRVARQIEAFKAQGDVVISISPDETVAQATQDSGGALQIAEQHLQRFEDQPLLPAAMYLEALGLVLHVAGLKKDVNQEEVRKHWQAMETIPWYAAQALSDRARLNRISQFAESMARATKKDRVEVDARTGGKVEYRKYDKEMAVGGRQSRGSAYVYAQVNRSYGFNVEVEDGETSKHGPLAVPPEAMVIILGTDKTQLSFYFSDAKVYSTNQADIWGIFQEGDLGAPGMKSAGFRGWITTPTLHENFGLPIEALVGEMMAQAYAKQWGRDRQGILERYQELEALRYQDHPVVPMPPNLKKLLEAVRKDSPESVPRVENAWRRYLQEGQAQEIFYDHAGRTVVVYVQNNRAGLAVSVENPFSRRDIDMDADHAEIIEVGEVPGLHRPVAAGWYRVREILHDRENEQEIYDEIREGLRSIADVEEAEWRSKQTGVIPLVPTRGSIPRSGVVEVLSRVAESTAASLHKAPLIGIVSPEDEKTAAKVADEVNKTDWIRRFYTHVARDVAASLRELAGQRLSLLTHPEGGDFRLWIDGLRLILMNQPGAVVITMGGPGVAHLDWEKLPEGLQPVARELRAMLAATYIPKDHQHEFMPGGRYALDPLMPTGKVREVFGRLLQVNRLTKDGTIQGDPDWDKLEIVQLGRERERLYGQAFEALKEKGAHRISPRHGTYTWALSAMRPPEVNGGRLRIVFTGSWLILALMNLQTLLAAGPDAWVSATPVPANVSDPRMIALQTDELPIGGGRNLSENEQAVLQQLLGAEKANALRSGSTFLTRRDAEIGQKEGEGKVYVAVVPVTPIDDAFGSPTGNRVRGLPGAAPTGHRVGDRQEFRSYPILIYDGHWFVKPSSIMAGPLPGDLKFTSQVLQGTGLEEPTVPVAEVKPAVAPIVPVAQLSRSLQEAFRGIQPVVVSPQGGGVIVDLTVDENGQPNPAAALAVPYLPEGTVAIVNSSDDLLTAWKITDQTTKAKIIGLDQVGGDFTATFRRAIGSFQPGSAVQFVTGRPEDQIRSIRDSLGGIAISLRIAASQTLAQILEIVGLSEKTRAAIITQVQRAQENWDGVARYL